MEPCSILFTGIWDCLNSQQVVDIVRRQVAEGKELSEICELICDHCLAPDTSSGADIGSDNMTILIVAILNGRTKEEWYAWVKQRVNDNNGYPTPSSLPTLYSASRLTSFQARRAALEARERLRQQEDRRSTPVSETNDNISVPASAITNDSSTLMSENNDEKEDSGGEGDHGDDETNPGSSDREDDETNAGSSDHEDEETNTGSSDHEDDNTNAGSSDHGDDNTKAGSSDHGDDNTNAGSSDHGDDKTNAGSLDHGDDKTNTRLSFVSQTFGLGHSDSLDNSKGANGTAGTRSWVSSGGVLRLQWLMLRGKWRARLSMGGGKGGVNL